MPCETRSIRAPDAEGRQAQVIPKLAARTPASSGKTETPSALTPAPAMNAMRTKWPRYMTSDSRPANKTTGGDHRAESQPQIGTNARIQASRSKKNAGPALENGWRSRKKSEAAAPSTGTANARKVGGRELAT